MECSDNRRGFHGWARSPGTRHSTFDRPRDQGVRMRFIVERDNPIASYQALPQTSQLHSPACVLVHLQTLRGSRDKVASRECSSNATTQFPIKTPQRDRRRAENLDLPRKIVNKKGPKWASVTRNRSQHFGPKPHVLASNINRERQFALHVQQRAAYPEHEFRSVVSVLL